jgi:hypothetical protein
MKFIRSIKTNFISIVLAILLGSLWHFVFDWLGKNNIIAAFFPVNESIWEHLKLLFYPVLLLSIMECIIRGVKPGFLVARTIGTIVGMFMILILYYSYSGIIGKDITIIDIIIFIISIFITYVISGMLIDKKFCLLLSYKIICVILLIGIITSFTLFTYNPPKIKLFLDHKTNIYSY